MRTWTIEFDNMQRDFEYWLRCVLADDRVIVTVAGDPTATMIPYEDYERWQTLETRLKCQPDTTTPAT